jgi:hypothetical protein
MSPVKTRTTIAGTADRLSQLTDANYIRA